MRGGVPQAGRGGAGALHQRAAGSARGRRARPEEEYAERIFALREAFYTECSSPSDGLEKLVLPPISMSALLDNLSDVLPPHLTLQRLTHPM